MKILKLESVGELRDVILLKRCGECVSTFDHILLRLFRMRYAFAEDDTAQVSNLAILDSVDSIVKSLVFLVDDSIRFFCLELDQALLVSLEPRSLDVSQ